MATPQQPNIIYIFSDQMRFDTMSCNGNPVIKTPYLDRLAQEGVNCTHAYSSFPLCSPFRASLLTGKYNHSTGLHGNHYVMPLDHEFMPDIMHRAGYDTCYFGKWHLEGGIAPGFVPPGPRRLGFEKMAGFNRGHYYMDAIYYYDEDEPRHCPRYEPDFQTEHLMRFMQDNLDREDDKPFFGMICYGAPHFPFYMPEYLKTLYRPEQVPLGPTALDRGLKERMARLFADLDMPQASGLWGTGGSEEILIEDEAAIREFVALYYGMAANIDWNVGRILNWLDAKGIADNTMVVFFSDHGDMFGEHGYRCGTKKCPYSAAAHIPLLVRWPDGGVKGGRVVDDLVDFAVDAMPTTLEACGLKTPDAVQGTSFLAQLRGEDAPGRDAVFYEVCTEKEGPERFPIPERGVRTRDWLYVRTPEKGTLLFDLKKDPGEEHNLVDDPAHAGARAALDARLAEHMRATDDDWSAEAVYPPPHFLDQATKTRIQLDMIKTAKVEMNPYDWGK